ncbi:MAG: hypothetical protein COB30_021090 [Ectothiorhodospiraceae bacterium]|nr:hypothetical protein [Ectothiorhodospiraceae bacterium]
MSDSIIHYYLYGEKSFEIIPGDFNELWMRGVIVILLVSFGAYVEISTKKLIEKEKQLEASLIYHSIVRASHHILNNLLNQMQLFRMEALNSHSFDKEKIKLYDSAMDEASSLIKQLSEVKNISDENIRASVAPRRTIHNEVVNMVERV